MPQDRQLRGDGETQLHGAEILDRLLGPQETIMDSSVPALSVTLAFPQVSAFFFTCLNAVILAALLTCI